MSQEKQPQRPVTYEDVFSVTRERATQPISKEDAAVMQSAETLRSGKTQKGGTAATMQSAADRNVQAHAAPKDAIDKGFSTVKTNLPKETVQTQLGQEQPVTYGDVLPVTSERATQPITKEDAARMQSAETLTLGSTQKGGTAAAMQSAADRNMQACPVPKDGGAHKGVPVVETILPKGKVHTQLIQDQQPQGPVTYGDVFSVTGDLATQPITKEDAALVQSTETRTLGNIQKGGAATMMQSAADQNVQKHALPKDAHSSVAGRGVSVVETIPSKGMVNAQLVQEQQPQRPVTYGDVFSVTGELATQPITKEDAALMQRAEMLTLGSTQKGGAAATMQSAADWNVQANALSKDAHSSVADKDVSVFETILSKEMVHTQLAEGHPISSSAPMVPAVAALQDTVTIGEALEAVAVRAGDKPIEASDASAIQSAEKRATRGFPTMPGSLAATAQAAAVLNPRVEDFAKTTLSDVLMDASVKLPNDKMVTWEDAERVAKVELRNKQTRELQEGGVAAALVAAAELNDKMNLAPSSQMEQLKVE